MTGAGFGINRQGICGLKLSGSGENSALFFISGELFGALMYLYK